jgi:hypothetical protein
MTPRTLVVRRDVQDQNIHKSSLISYPTDAQLNIPRRMLKFTLILALNAPTCFGPKRPSSESVAFVLR